MCKAEAKTGSTLGSMVSFMVICLFHTAHPCPVSIFNPSSLDLATGDLSRLFFDSLSSLVLTDIQALQLFREGVALGTALLPNLTLHTGNNTFLATSILR